ncbi:hypothetical protein EI94DRAFT_1311506 [Lactarius quietus]|nr:hypothetical protein EI94DRAFT_1311506 [Lactarius quietus]
MRGGKGHPLVPPRRNMKNIRECSRLGRNIWGWLAFSTKVRLYRVLCSGWIDLSCARTACDRYGPGIQIPKNKRPGQGPLNEQIPKIHLLQATPTHPLHSPPTLASGECGFLLCFYPLILLLLFSITVSFCSFAPSFALIPRSVVLLHTTHFTTMSSFLPPRSCFLDPLEEFPLVVPFPEAPLLPRFLLRRIQHRVLTDNILSGPGALGLFNETPSTIDMSLPTPSIPVFTVLSFELPPTAQVHYETPIPQSESIQPPPAPLVKDMDSFSEGTAQGSFDFTLCSDPGDAQAPPSVAFSPDHPTLSIEVWRDDVSRSTTVGREEQHPPNGEDTHISETRPPSPTLVTGGSLLDVIPVTRTLSSSWRILQRISRSSPSMTLYSCTNL